MKKVFLIIMALAMLSLDAEARRPQTGYRGFLEWSNDLKSYDMWSNGDKTTTLHTGVSTSHGRQFNPWLFAGAGLVFEHCSKLDSNILAPFIQGRADLQFGKFTPFGDIRLGYNLSRGGGIYFSPTVGYRLNWGRKMGINLGLGLTLQRYKYDQYEITYSPENYYVLTKTGTSHDTTTFFTFRVGIDF